MEKINFAWTLIWFTPPGSSLWFCIPLFVTENKLRCCCFNSCCLSMKWYPSKLMGCNHHHKYIVTRPTAHSWVFNSQSMGCKDWQVLHVINYSRLEEETICRIFHKWKISAICSTFFWSAGANHLLDVHVTYSQYYWNYVSVIHQHCHLVK